MDQRVDTVIAFMKENLHRKLTPIEIAQSVHLSPAHLRKLFNDETGSTLTRYGNELRLEQAKHLLETTFLSIKEVAASVGLDGVTDFLRDFKKAYGMIPTEYAECYRSSRHSP